MLDRLYNAWQDCVSQNNELCSQVDEARLLAVTLNDKVKQVQEIANSWKCIALNARADALREAADLYSENPQVFRDRILLRIPDQNVIDRKD